MSNPAKMTESAGGVVINEHGLVLVVSQHGTSWSLPKGHIDPGEDKLTAARREIYEESGINQIELLLELGSYERFRIGKNGQDDLTEYKKIFIFLFRTNQHALNPIDPHNPQAVWVEKHKVADLLTHPKDRDFFKSVLDKI
jgi:8-oxo-dGTP pyrophosphatase MutT (NUDIX family)